MQLHVLPCGRSCGRLASSRTRRLSWWGPGGAGEVAVPRDTPCCGPALWLVSRARWLHSWAERGMRWSAGEKGRRETEKCLGIVSNAPVSFLIGHVHGRYGNRRIMESF